MTSMRADPAEFQKLDLRCHAFLRDVPLHDVWAIPLDDGGPARTINDVRAILFADRRSPTNLAVRGLFALRWTIGRALATVLFECSMSSVTRPSVSCATRPCTRF